MSKHTPGPWMAGAIMGRDENSHKPGVIDITYHGRTIAMVTPGTVSGDSLIATEANANLIAAAPDMLEALKDNYLTVEAHAERYPGDREAQRDFAKVRAAIAKAEGK